MKTKKAILNKFILSLKNYSSSSVDMGFGFERSYKLTEKQLCDLIDFASHPEPQPQEQEKITGQTWECPRCHQINSYLKMTCDCPPQTFTSTTIGFDVLREQKKTPIEQIREAFEPIQLGESSVVNQAMDLASRKCGKREQDNPTQHLKDMLTPVTEQDKNEIRDVFREQEKPFDNNCKADDDFVKVYEQEKPQTADNRYYDAMKFLADWNEITVSDIDAAIINYIQGKIATQKHIPTDVKEVIYPNREEIENEGFKRARELKIRGNAQRVSFFEGFVDCAKWMKEQIK